MMKLLLPWLQVSVSWALVGCVFGCERVGMWGQGVGASVEAGQGV